MNDIDKAKLAAKIDDVDFRMLPSGRLGACAMRHGVDVCWGCFKPFSQHIDREMPVEVTASYGAPPYLLHKGCVGRTDFSQVVDIAQGMKMRRDMANVARATNLGAPKVFG